MAASAAPLTALDWALVAAYFIMVALVGLACYLKERSAAQQQQAKADNFFLAGRSMGWLPIGLSLFVSNIGSEHLVGLAGSAAAGGIAVGIYEWTAGLQLVVLGYLFSPIYLRTAISTLPEYLERRFSRRLRALFSAATLLIYIFTKLSVSVFSGATVLHAIFGWQMMPAALGLVALTALYTVLGGLAAVIVTDMAQAAIMLLGALCMTLIGLARVGGLAGLRASPPPELSADEWDRFFHLYRAPDDPQLPTLGIVLGQTVCGMWYWCLDQAIVQRVLSARSLGHAQASTVFAGFLKISPVFIMVLPGIIARRLYAEELEDSNQALPVMMKRMLPPGVLGLMLAATIAACMSSLDSVFTAAASLFCLDLYKPYWKPAATDADLVRVGRVFCAVLAVLTLLWMPVISLLSDQVFVYIQSISNYLAPSVVTCYFGGVLWWRANAQGAMAAFVVGFALGLVRLAGEIALKAGLAGSPPSALASALFGLQYLYVGFIIFVVSTLTLVVVSLATPRPAQEQLHSYCLTLTQWPGTTFCRSLVHRLRTTKPQLSTVELGNPQGVAENTTTVSGGKNRRKQSTVPMLTVQQGSQRSDMLQASKECPSGGAPPEEGLFEPSPSELKPFEPKLEPKLFEPEPSERGASDAAASAAELPAAQRSAEQASQIASQSAEATARDQSAAPTGAGSLDASCQQAVVIQMAAPCIALGQMEEERFRSLTSSFAWVLIAVMAALITAYW